MTKPDVPDPRPQTGSRPLQELSARLSGLQLEAIATRGVWCCDVLAKLL
jgi:hypothetical protein